MSIVSAAGDSLTLNDHFACANCLMIHPTSSPLSICTLVRLLLRYLRIDVTIIEGCLFSILRIFLDYLLFHKGELI